MRETRLYCLPYAGGSATVYKHWEEKLDHRIELHLLELAGRGKRFKEPCAECCREIVDDLYTTIRGELGVMSYAFYAHSMGTLLAYELTRKIIKNGYRQPVRLFLSGRHPPHVEKDHRILHLLSDEEFAEEIFKLGGTSPGVFQKKDLFNVFIPILKADYKVVETYELGDCKNH